MKEFSFLEATPLINFIEKNKNKIIGNTIRKFYSSSYFGDLSSQPIAFSLDGFDIILTYFYYSDLKINIVESGAVQKHPDLDFLHEGAPSVYKPTYTAMEDEFFPYANCKISDISIERFSKAFEINPVTEEMRPEGGDYFKTITVYLENGKKFYISGMSADYDGYVSVWDDE